MSDQENQASRFARDMAVQCRENVQGNAADRQYQRRGCQHRHDAETSRHAPRQGGAVPLRTDGGGDGEDARPSGLRPDRTLHDGRSAARSFAGAQPAVEGPRPLADRLGPAEPGRTMAQHRRLRRRLHRCGRGSHRAGDRARQGDAARHLRRRCLYDMLRRLASREGKESGHHHHADRFPRRCQGQGRASRLSQPLDPQP